MIKTILNDLLHEVEEYYNSELSYVFNKMLDGKYKCLVDNKECTIKYFEHLGYCCEIDKPYLTPLIHIYRVNKNNNSITKNIDKKEQQHRHHRMSFYEILGYADYHYVNGLMCGGPLG